MIPELVQWLSDYDSGKVMESVRMDAIYSKQEKYIQKLAIQTLRSLQNQSVPHDNDDHFFQLMRLASSDAYFHSKEPYTLSVAQFHAAENIAAMFWRQTPNVAIQMAKDTEPTRIIRIKKGNDDNVIIINYIN